MVTPISKLSLKYYSPKTISARSSDKGSDHGKISNESYNPVETNWLVGGSRKIPNKLKPGEESGSYPVGSQIELKERIETERGFYDAPKVTFTIGEPPLEPDNFGELY